MTVRRCALLGFGNVAEHGHLPAWRRRTEVRLVAVADPDPARRARAAELVPEARLYDDATRLLREEVLDFVDVATPPSTHAPLVVTAARVGCHVLCEKPLACHLEDHRSVVEAIADAGTTLHTVHNWKHAPQFARASALLSEGAIGAVEHVHLETTRRQPAVAVGDDWRGRAAIAGGGILIDHGWHSFYLLSSFVGQAPLRLGATIERRRWVAADVEDTASCWIEFPSARGEIQLTWAGAARRTSWELRGSEGAMSVAGDRLELRRGSRAESFTFAQSLAEGSHHPEWFDSVIDGFCAEVDGRLAGGVNQAEAAHCVALLVLSYASAARSGEPVPVPRELWPTPTNGESGSGRRVAG